MVTPFGDFEVSQINDRRIHVPRMIRTRGLSNHIVVVVLFVRSHYKTPYISDIS